MENQQLFNYIQLSIQQGKDKDEIKNSLLASGWQDTDIEKVFTTIHQNNIQPVIPQPPQTTQTGSVLPGVFSLIHEAWGLYKQRVKTFIGIMFIPATLVVVIGLIQPQLEYLAEQSPNADNLLKIAGLSIFLTLISLISIIFSLMGQSALFFSIKDSKENTGVMDSYRKALSYFFSYIWVLILMGCIVLGGFLLFIIPGIIFMTSFSFAIVILINENEKGMNALLKSREYVRGMWWAIFGKSFTAGLIISLPLYGISAILYILKVPYYQIISTFLYSFFLLPLIFSFHFLLYQHVRTIKGNVLVDTSAGKKAPFVLIGTLAPIFTIGLIIMISIFSFLSAVKKQTTVQNKTISGTVATSTLGMELITYTNNEFGYSLNYPKTWGTDIQSNEMSTSIFFTEPDNDNSLLKTTITITTAKLPAPQSIETTTENYKQALKNDNQVTNNTLIEDSTTTFIGLPAHTFISTKPISLDDGKTFINRKQKSILFTVEKTIFNVEYKNDIDSFDLMEPLVDSIITTFVLHN